MRRPDKPAPTEKHDGVHPPAPHHSSGRALARLQLLILIHPPLREAEWRCSSGEWRAAPFDAVEHAACRSKRSRPEGSVPGWIPQRRNAEPKRGAGRRGEPFWVLFAGPALRRLKKVTRRKGETVSRRYRSNGYVRGQQHTGRLSGRLRCDAAPRQASSKESGSKAGCLNQHQTESSNSY